MQIVRLFAFASVLLLSVSAGVGQAGVVLYDNTAQNTPPLGGSVPVTSVNVNGPLASSFSALDNSSGYTLTSVVLSLNVATDALVNGAFSIQLLADSSNSPGSSIYTIATVKDNASNLTSGSDINQSFTTTPTLFTFNASYTLSAGIRYWIAIVGDSTSSSAIQWGGASGSSGAHVSLEYNAITSGGSYSVSSNSDFAPFIMQVNADEITTIPPPPAVPEPTTVVLATFGAVAAFVARRRLA